MKSVRNIIPLIIMTLSLQTAAAGCSNTNTTESKIDQISRQGLKHDTFKTGDGETIDLIFIKHGSLMIDVDNTLIYIDPVKMFGTDFGKLPKANMVLVTHEHHDHFDKDAINEIKTPSTRLIMSQEVEKQYGSGEAMTPGQTISVDNNGKSIDITTVPAYNISEGHLNFHPKDRKDLGFIFTIGDKRIYVAGDTEDIPEMGNFKNIDIAFLPINQPYTMTPQQAIHAVEMLAAGRDSNRVGKLVIYPYHYGDTDLTPMVEYFKDSPTVDIRIREMQ